MAADLAALIPDAARTLVSLMVTDSWAQAKTAFVSLWQRAQPERAKVVDSELAAARLELLAARQALDEEAEVELTAEWRSRLRRLAAIDQQIEQDLGRLLEEFRPLLAETEDGRASSVIMRAKATGHSRVNQAGRDQTVVEL